MTDKALATMRKRARQIAGALKEAEASTERSALLDHALAIAGDLADSIYRYIKLDNLERGTK